MRTRGKNLSWTSYGKRLLLVSLCFFCFLGMTVPGYSQIKDARIKVGGLTCSQCSRSVEMELRKLNFVQDVDMDLENTQTLVYFKPGVDVDWTKLAKAASNAGFKTLSVQVDITPAQTKISNNEFVFQGRTFRFVDPAELPVSETGRFQIIAQGFVSNKTLKSYQNLTKITTNNHTYLLKKVED